MAYFFLEGESVLFLSYLLPINSKEVLVATSTVYKNGWVWVNESKFLFGVAMLLADELMRFYKNEG